MTYTYTYVEVERHVYVCLRAYTVVHAVGAICVSGRSGYYACQPVHRHGYPVNVANRCYVVVGWCVWSLARVRGCRAACSRSGPTNSCELARLRAHVLTRVGREARGHMYVHTRWPRWGGAPDTRRGLHKACGTYTAQLYNTALHIQPQANTRHMPTWHVDPTRASAKKTRAPHKHCTHAGAQMKRTAVCNYRPIDIK